MMARGLVTDHTTFFADKQHFPFTITMMTILMGRSAQLKSAFDKSVAATIGRRPEYFNWQKLISPFRGAMIVFFKSVDQEKWSSPLSEKERMQLLRGLDDINDVIQCPKSGEEAENIAVLYSRAFILTEGILREMGEALTNNTSISICREEPLNLRLLLSDFRELKIKAEAKYEECERLIKTVSWYVENASPEAKRRIKEATDGAVAALDSYYRVVELCLNEVVQVYMKKEDPGLEPEHLGLSSWDEIGLGDAAFDGAVLSVSKV